MQRSEDIADQPAPKKVPFEDVEAGEKRHIDKGIDQVDHREIHDENVWYSSQLFKMVNNEAQ